MRVRDWWWEAVPIHVSAKTVALKSLPNHIYIAYNQQYSPIYKRTNTRFRCLSRNHSDHVWIIKLFFSFICFSIATYTYIWVTQQKQKIKNENLVNIIYLFEIIILILYYNNILYYGGIPLVIFPRETCEWAWRSAALQQSITPVSNIHI